MLTEESRRILADARRMHTSALERLEAGDVRDAAEKAWCAVKRATDALILASTGAEPPRTTNTSAGIRSLSHARGGQYTSLRDRYGAAAHHLHGDCFYDGLCEPEDDIANMVRQTSIYIDDCERLA